MCAELSSNATVPGTAAASGRLPEFSFEAQSSISFDGKFLKPGELARRPDPMMPLLDAIWTRRTSRAYSPEPVDRERFEWLVSVAMNAPTACNEQQWKIVHIENPEIIQDLYERGAAAFLQNTRQCFLLCYNRRNDNPFWHDHVQSGAAFITTFQLLAHTLGIGSCWVCHLPNKRELRRMFRIPRCYDPVALITYGYYRGKMKIMPRKHSATRIVMYERFDSAGLLFASHRKTLIRLVIRWLYYQVPAAIRRYLRPRSIPYEKKFYYEIFD
jgi:nitroreductase